MDCLNPEQRRKAMVANRSSNTTIELMLRKALWHKGVRYRKNFKICTCRPDIVITKYKVAIFCDGDFWHGKRNVEKCSHYWNEKIKRNIERDLENTIALRDSGWFVLRFWETEIRHDLERCVADIFNIIEVAKSRSSKLY